MNTARKTTLAVAVRSVSASAMAHDAATLFGYLADTGSVRANAGAGISSTWRESGNLSFLGMKGNREPDDRDRRY